MFTTPKLPPTREDDDFDIDTETDVLSTLLDEAEQAERDARPQPAVDPPPRRLYTLD